MAEPTRRDTSRLSVESDQRMNDVTIEVEGLRKRFGPAVALDGMTFTVAPGQVTGFIGPNGAGKSTTMRVILALDAADQGQALVGGQPYASLRRPLTVLGSLLDAAAVQPSRSARGHLLWLAHSQGLTASRVDEVLEQAGLAGVAGRRAGGFSLGMRQRLGIAAALLGDPPALMLDEPFNGMDPEGIVWMRGFLRALAAGGRAVLVSSHLMSELQDTAHHLIVVGRGKVIADTRVADLIAAASGGRVTVRTTAGPAATTVLTRAGAIVIPAGSDALTISGLAAEQVIALLGEARVPFSEVSANRATLEQAYLELTSQSVEYPALVPISIIAPFGTDAAHKAMNRPVSGVICRRRWRWGVPSSRSRSSRTSSLCIRSSTAALRSLNIGPPQILRNTRSCGSRYTHDKNATTYSLSPWSRTRSSFPGLRPTAWAGARRRSLFPNRR